MGLIKAAAAAISGTMDDIWKEMFVCDSLPADILMVRGVKRVSNRSANTGGAALSGMLRCAQLDNFTGQREMMRGMTA